MKEENKRGTRIAATKERVEKKNPKTTGKTYSKAETRGEIKDANGLESEKAKKRRNQPSVAKEGGRVWLSMAVTYKL